MYGMVFDIFLVFNKWNKYGTELYIDPHHRSTLKMEEVSISLEREVWMSSQGGQYIDQIVECYALTQYFE